MTGHAGFEKPQDCSVTVTLRDAGGVEILLQSKQEKMFGNAIRSCAENCLEELDVKNALVEIRLQSRQEAMFGSTIRSCAESCLEELGVENALVEIQDYGCLDFAIRARLKTAVRRARRYEHG